MVATAAIHLHLWLAGYRHVPRLGPLFMAQASGGIVLAVALSVGRHTITVIAGALFMAASAAGLILSATVGFVGIHDGLGVPWATPSLIVELVGLVFLAGALATRASYVFRRSSVSRRWSWWALADGNVEVRDRRSGTTHMIAADIAARPHSEGAGRDAAQL